MQNNLPLSVIEMATRLHLQIEDGYVMHSEDQGESLYATVCVDRWLSARSGDIRMEVRVLQRASCDDDWQSQDVSLQSDPLTEAQALQLIDHWGRTAQEATRLAQLAERQERERLNAFGPRPKKPWEAELSAVTANRQISQ